MGRRNVRSTNRSTQTSGRTVGSVSAILDSAVAQYDFREEDGSLPITDQTGNGNSINSGSYTGVGRSINGQQAGEFNGNDDQVSGTFGSTINQRWVIFTVSVHDVTSDMSLGGSEDNTAEFFQFSNQRRMNLGSNTIGSPNVVSTGTPVLLTWIGDSTGIIRRNGSEIVSGSSGSASLNGVKIGRASSVRNYWDGAVGFWEVHSGNPSNGLTTREQEIADDWGITI